MQANRNVSIYLIAGEPSGDTLGAHLMRSLKKQAAGNVRFYGIGGEQMEREGMASLFPYHDLAMMGFAEIVPHLMKIAARMGQTLDDIRTKQPDIVITIDSPGFNKQLVKKLRKEHSSARFVHVVAPSVWAWKPGRAKSFAQLFDHLLCLLPFEPPYFEKEGLAATFVGHPVAQAPQAGDAAAFRARHNIAPNTPLFAVLPGSRRGEIKRHLPIFAQTIALLSESYPNLAIIVPVPKYLLPVVKPYFDDCPFRAVVSAHAEDKHDGLAAANLAIVKSGTVTLEVAKAGRPMVVAYRVSAISAFIYRRLRLTKLATLVNILLGREAIPELLQEDCTPVTLASAAQTLLRTTSLADEQQAAVTQAFAQLAPPGGNAGDIAANVVFHQLA